MKCQVCGKKSGFFPTCKACHNLINEGKVSKCQKCEEWHDNKTLICDKCASLLKLNGLEIIKTNELPPEPGLINKVILSFRGVQSVNIRLDVSDENFDEWIQEDLIYNDFIKSACESIKKSGTKDKDLLCERLHKENEKVKHLFGYWRSKAKIYETYSSMMIPGDNTFYELKNIILKTIDCNYKFLASLDSIKNSNEEIITMGRDDSLFSILIDYLLLFSLEPKDIRNDDNFKVFLETATKLKKSFDNFIKQSKNIGLMNELTRIIKEYRADEDNTIKASYYDDCLNRLFEWKVDYNRKIKTDCGLMVQSEGEKMIADLLDKHNIGYDYDEKLTLRGIEKSKSGYDTKWARPDFYLTEFNIIIEYWGLKGTPDYDEKMEDKKRLYKEANQKFISIEPKNLNNIEEILIVKLKRMGVNI